MPSPSSPPIPTALSVYAELKPSYRCNHSCVFCIWNARKTLRPMTREQVAANLSVIQHKIKPSGIILSGGEPLLYPGLEFILSRLADMEFLQDFHLHTNATAVARVPPKLLAGAAPRRSATIGIHGHTARTYGVVSGSVTSFLKAREGIGLLKDLGYSLRASVVICRHNLEELSDLSQFLLEEGFAIVELRLPVLGPGMPEEDIFLEFRQAAPHLEQWRARFHGRPEVRLISSGAGCFETIVLDPEEKVFYFFDPLRQMELFSSNLSQLAAIWSEVYAGYQKGPACCQCLLSEDCRGYSPAEVRYGYARFRPVRLEDIVEAVH